MLYDFESLTPLYELEVGKPGHSYALELVQKTGFSPQIIEAMKMKVSKKVRNFDEITKKLENEYVQYHKKRIQAETKQRIADNLIKEYRELKDVLEGNKKEFVRQGKAEAREIVKTANKKIENAIATIRSSKAEPIPSRQVDKVKSSSNQGPIKVGDVVKVVSTGAKGELLRSRGNKSDVQVGNFIMSVKTDELIKLSGGNKFVKENNTTSRSSFASIDEGVSFRQELDIRGLRANEAIKSVEVYVDKCIMFDANSVRIIHGKGDGILRDIVRKTLSEFRQITSFKDEHVDYGGAGVTVLTF